MAEDNTASATGVNSSTATGQVCNAADLTVSKNKVVSLTRTYPWTITKTADDSSITVDPATGGTGTAHWTITVDKGGPASDTDWRMTGAITVNNPNNFESIKLTGLTDVYGGGGTCTINGWANMTEEQLTIPANGSQVYNYTCTFDEKPAYDGTNTATATWSASTAHTPHGSASGEARVQEADWSLNEIQRSFDVVDDNATAQTDDAVVLDSVDWVDDIFPKTIRFSRPVSTGVGQCTNYLNKAWLADASAPGTPVVGPAQDTVEVCAPGQPKLTLVKRVVTENGGNATVADWTLSADGPGSNDLSGISATAAVTGVEVVAGSYNLSEAATNAPGPAGYSPSAWSCTKQMSGAAQVTLTYGDDVTCTIVNSSGPLTYTAAKSAAITASPGPDGTVLPGGEITYTVRVTKTGGVDGPVKITDDLSAVLDNASYVDGSLSSAAASITGNTLTWNIANLTAAGATLTYKVTVDDDAWDVNLVNVITPETPGGTCEPNCGTDTQTPQKPRLTLIKNVVNGLNSEVPASAWTLTATPSAGGDAAVTGSGRATGQVVPGSYSLAEAGGPSGFTAGDWSCDKGLRGTTVTVAVGDDITCQITNTRNGEYTVEKTSDPTDGATVVVGQEIDYTLTVEHTVGVKPTGVQLVDDLSGVLSYADMVTVEWPEGVTFDAATKKLTWNVGAFGDNTTQSLTYTVRTKVEGVLLENSVTSVGSNCVPGQDGVLPPECVVTHPVAGWTMRKDSDPATGSQVVGGENVTYTLTVHNTSADAALEGATVVDNLTEVLAKATMVTTFPADGPATFDPVTKKLVWKVPTIAAGSTTPATFSYTVKVNEGVQGLLVNVAAPGPATGEGGSPVNGSGKCEKADACSTNHQVIIPVAPPVAPPVVVPPAAPPAAPVPPKNWPPKKLPHTGGPGSQWLPVGGLLLVLGTGAMLVGRRRRES